MLRPSYLQDKSNQVFLIRIIFFLTVVMKTGFTKFILLRNVQKCVYIKSEFNLSFNGWSWFSNMKDRLKKSILLFLAECNINGRNDHYCYFTGSSYNKGLIICCAQSCGQMLTLLRCLSYYSGNPTQLHQDFLKLYLNCSPPPHILTELFNIFFLKSMLALKNHFLLLQVWNKPFV